MKLRLITLALMFVFGLFVSGGAAAQSLAHNYESFFGKDDRIGLYSEEASKRFSETALKTIRDNTLLIDCGFSGKPSTAFVVKTASGTQIMSAGHNLTMAMTNDSDCRLSGKELPQGKASPLFKDNSTKEDAGYDLATWPNITSHGGFNICKTISTSSKLILVQSMDGTGKIGISPGCKMKAINSALITTTCKGHYKASGAPLLSVSEDNICAAGVFNAHSGKAFNYESYAARLIP